MYLNTAFVAITQARRQTNALPVIAHAYIATGFVLLSDSRKSVFHRPVAHAIYSNPLTNIYRDIVQRLRKTGVYDRVLYPNPIEEGEVAASDKSVAAVIPGGVDDTAGYDDFDGTSTLRKVQWTLDLRIRSRDPALDDIRLAQMVDAARGAVNRRSLADTTLPALTLLRVARPAVSKPPERRVMLMGEFTYVVDEPDELFDDPGDD